MNRKALAAKAIGIATLVFLEASVAMSPPANAMAPPRVAAPKDMSVSNQFAAPANQALLDRATRLCARVPALISRTDSLTTRLPAGPDTPGSIAAIRERASLAQNKGRAQIAQALNTRADSLTQRLATLPNQKAKLVQVNQKCQQLGLSSQ